MHIIFRLFRQREIHHVADVIDVQSAASHIGSDQDLDFGSTELFQRTHPFRLRHFSRQQSHLGAVAMQVVGQFAGLVTPIGEHNHALAFVGLNEVIKQRVLLVGGNEIYHLLDVVRGLPHRCHFDLDRVQCPPVGQRKDIVGEGGTEQHGLAAFLARRLRNDLAHLRNEPHVEHAVSFVQHQHFDHAKPDGLLADKVDQTTGRCYDYIDDAALKILQLFLIIHATDQRDDFQPGVFAQQLGVLGDLHHQFARWRNDQRTRLADITLFVERVIEEVGDDGSEEGGSLAGPGLGLAGDVVPLQSDRNALCLNGSAILETKVVESPEQGFRQLEITEAHIAHGIGRRRSANRSAYRSVDRSADRNVDSSAIMNGNRGGGSIGDRIDGLCCRVFSLLGWFHARFSATTAVNVVTLFTIAHRTGGNNGIAAVGGPIACQRTQLFGHSGRLAVDHHFADDSHGGAAIRRAVGDFSSLQDGDVFTLGSQFDPRNGASRNCQ